MWTQNGVFSNETLDTVGNLLHPLCLNDSLKRYNILTLMYKTFMDRRPEYLYDRYVLFDVQCSYAVYSFQPTNFTVF